MLDVPGSLDCNALYELSNNNHIMEYSIQCHAVLSVVYIQVFFMHILQIAVCF